VNRRKFTHESRLRSRSLTPQQSPQLRPRVQDICPIDEQVFCHNHALNLRRVPWGAI
jgi:hypothetical protein